MSTIKVDTIATRTGSGNITLSNSLASATIAGDLAVDTNVLKVDSTNNKVGINVTSPDAMLQVQNGDITVGWADNFIGTQFQTGSDFRLGMKFATVARTLKLVAETNDNNGEITFETNGSERARVTDNGITFNGDTASANALNDYETGSWTVGVTKNAALTSPNSSHAYYIRVGNLAFLSFYWYKTNVTTSGSDYWTITGIPFALRAGAASGYQHGHVGYLNIAGDKTGNGNHRWQVNTALQFLLYGGNSTTNVSNQAVELSGSVTCRIA